MDHSLSPHGGIPHEPLLPDTGASFGTHVLSADSSRAWKFVPSLGVVGFATAISALGVGGAVMGIGGFLALQEVGTLLIVLVGGGCIWLGRYLYRQVNLPREIDFLARRIRFPIRQRSRGTEIREVTFDEIRALQVVEKRIRGTEQDFYSFELNLVMVDGNRINLLDHGNGKRLIDEATRITTRLGKDLIVEEI